MECRKFEITLMSASNLEDVRRMWKMKVYCRVTIGQEKEKRTGIDKHGEVNPSWNHIINFTVRDSILNNYNTMLVIKLYCKRKLGDRYVGEVSTSMKELFDCAQSSGGCAVLTYPVQKGCINSQGELRFSYRFGHKVMIDKLVLAETIASNSPFINC